MDLVTGWTGRAACALQAALRMSNEAFAAHLGIGVRTVAAWHQKPGLRPRPEMQQVLDAALARAPVEITFKTGKDAFGWDQCQARTYHALCRHTALTALAPLRTAAIQAALAGADVLPAAPPAARTAPAAVSEPATSAADLQIYTGTAPLPARGGQPCPPGIPPIRLSAAETARIDRLARDWKAGLISLARLAFQLRWSAWRRRHQARARWHHYSTRLAALAT